MLPNGPQCLKTLITLSALTKKQLSTQPRWSFNPQNPPFTLRRNSFMFVYESFYSTQAGETLSQKSPNFNNEYFSFHIKENPYLPQQVNYNIYTKKKHFILLQKTLNQNLLIIYIYILRHFFTAFHFYFTPKNVTFFVVDIFLDNSNLANPNPIWDRKQTGNILVQTIPQ